MIRKCKKLINIYYFYGNSNNNNNNNNRGVHYEEET